VTYQVAFTAVARRDLHRVPPRIVSAVVECIYGDLAAQPRRVGNPLDRELSGSHGAHRGNYRIIYDIDDPAERINILRIDHRADIDRPR
jgi:mRNA-degrading endonuclease RelE of RelBE toxin-antitoxin system